MMIVGGVDTGWTFTTPLSTHYLNTNVIAAAMGIFIAGFSSILTGVNFIVTIHKMRAPGMTWFRLPLFIWSYYATSIIFVLATPVIAISMVLIVLERVAGIGVFDPTKGGDPLLFSTSLLVLFSSCRICHDFARNGDHLGNDLLLLQKEGLWLLCRGVLIGRDCCLCLFCLGAPHVHHGHINVFCDGLFIFHDVGCGPSAIKVFNWSATLYKGSITFDTPMIYTFGFLGLFTIGGLTGVMLASLGMDIHLTETYFIVAHFHYVMVGGMVSAFMAGLHFWWPKMTGRMYPETQVGWQRSFFSLVSILPFSRKFILGVLGMPRRYHAYPPEFQVLNVMSTAGASILAIGYLLPFLYLIWSLKYGEIAGANPWGATGLEWTTQSPPLTENFAEVPIVNFEAYDYERIAPSVEVVD